MIDSLWVDYALCICKWRFVVFCFSSYASLLKVSRFVSLCTLCSFPFLWVVLIGGYDILLLFFPVFLMWL